MKRILLTATTILAAILLQAKGTAPVNVSMAQNRAPLSFIENKGQVTDQNRKPRADIQFSIKAAPGLNIFIGNGAIHYQFSQPVLSEAEGQGALSPAGWGVGGGEPDAISSSPEEKGKNLIPTAYNMYRMDVELINANPNAQIITEQKQDYYENYYTDWSGEQGATAHTYTRITYKNIYPYIDWVFYIKNGQLEHEFVIQEGGKASDIHIKYGGATGLKINANGSLSAATPQGTINEQAPKSYAINGAPVKSAFKLSGNVLSYETGEYGGELIIDPTLLWATYYGGNGGDMGMGIVTDSVGNVYISGGTASLSGIATVGAYQTVGDSINSDAFLAKFTSAGIPVWGTYYGGSGLESPSGLSIDRGGNLYFTGTTGSASGIASAGAHQTTLAGGWDGFLAKFNSAGARVWSTYFGSPGTEVGTALATDTFGNTYITGETNGTTGIVYSNAYQTSIFGSFDLYLAKFNSAGVLQWGTVYGGNGIERPGGAATDAAGNIYLTGYTSSGGLYTSGGTGFASPGAYNTTGGPGSSNQTYVGFLMKYTPAGSPSWATYYGGTGGNLQNQTNGVAVATDKSGNVYFTGMTAINNGIATAGAYQTTLGGNYDAFLAKFDNAGHILWGTYYGGPAEDAGPPGQNQGIATDTSGNVYIVGCTSSSTHIATAGVYQDSLIGQQDGYLAEFSTTGAIQWATYYGTQGFSTGDGGTDGNAATVDIFGNIYVTGNTPSYQGFATPGAYLTTGDSVHGRAFIAKFSLCNLPVVSAITGPTMVCAQGTINLTDTATGGTWASSNTNLGTVSGGEVSGVAAGLDTITYSVTNGCGTTTVSYPVTVNAAPTINAVTNKTICNGDSLGYIHFTGTGTGITYNWTCNNTSIGIAAGGTGNIPSFPAVNTGNTPVVATVTATPVAATGYAYFGLALLHDVVVVNTSTNLVVDTISVGNNPEGIAVSPDGSKVYVTNSNNPSGTVSVISTATNTVIATISVGNSPFGVAVSPDGSKVYVANINSNTVSVINAATNLVIATINGLIYPVGLVVSPDGSKLYVTNNGVSGSVSVINTATNAITATINVYNQPNGIAVSPDGSKLYVANSYSDSLSVINTSTNLVTANIILAGAPYDVAVSPDGSKVYASLLGSNSISIINAATNLVIDTINVASPYGICISPDGSKVYINHGVINTAAHTFTNIISVGQASFNFGNFITGGTGCNGTQTTFTITVNPSPTATYTTSTGHTHFCQGDSLTLTAGTETGYFWSTGATTQSIVVSTGGNEGVTVTDNHGCTASASQNISAFSVPASSIVQGDTGFCPGDSVTLSSVSQFQYLWSTGATTQNIVVKQTGSYTVIATNPVGCTNTSAAVRVAAYTPPPATINGPGSICANLSATLTASGGTGYNWSNGLGTNAQVSVSPVNNTTYYVTVTDAHSCTATAQQTVNVTTAPVASITGPTHICSGYDVILHASGGNTYSWSGGLGTADSIEDFPGQATTYTVTVSIGGNCTATASQTVNVYPEVFTYPFDSICAGQTYPFAGHNLTQGGTYYDTLQTIHGCDSVIILQLTVKNAAQTSIADTTCHGSAYVFNGRSLTQTGTYKDTLQAVAGCDSVVTLNLYVKSPLQSYLADTTCSGTPYTFNGFSLTQSGIYIDTVQTHTGCDSVVILSLWIDTVTSPTITRHGDTLNTQTFNSYQWLLNGTTLTGSAQSLVVTQNGNYSVAVTGAGGCTDTSAIISVTTLNIQRISGEYGVKLFPNPNTGNFTLQFTDDAERSIEITDAVGRIVVAPFKVARQQQFTLSDLAPGIYMLRITEDSGIKSLKFSVMKP